MALGNNVYVVAAICGCWWRESNVNPAVWESLTPTTWDHQYQYDGIGGYGLGQWTNVNTKYGRCYNLHTWVTANGYSDGDGDGQLAFMVHENYWTKCSYSYCKHDSLTDFLGSSSTDINSLVKEWMASWEGVAGDHIDERINHANVILPYLQAHKGETATWTAKNNYLTQAEILNNSLCVYNWLLTGKASPTSQVANNAVKYAIKIAEDNNCGYNGSPSTAPRKYGDAISGGGYPTMTQFDCSELVICAYKFGGGLSSLACTYTGDMYADMIAKGFTDVTSQINLSTGDGLKNGDVLLNTEDHTEIYVESYNGSTNMKVGAHSDYDGVKGDSSGREINVSSYSNFPWNYVLRYAKGGGGGDFGVSSGVDYALAPNCHD